MSQPEILASAPRCGARTRSGAPCRSPAVQGHRRCRMHGGRGSGAPRGNRNAWKHGTRSAWIRDVARYLRATSPAATRRMLFPESAPAAENKKTAIQPHAPGKMAENTAAALTSFRHAEPDPGSRFLSGRIGTAIPPISPRSSPSTHGTAPSAATPVDRWRNDIYPDGMIDRRDTLALLGAALAFGGEALAAPARPDPARAAGAGQPFDWDWLKRHAAALARARPRPLPRPDPRAHAVDYDAANRIAFRPDRALFAPGGVDDGYAVRLFPLVRNAPIPVRVSVVDRGRARPVEHAEDMFAIMPGPGPAGAGQAPMPPIVPGIAGFRVMNRGGVGDWLAFLGASYFRAAGPLAQYGLSARGLAIDTGIDGREEFPVFTAFWLERAGAERGGGLIIYALLEGPSVTGAFRFDSRKADDATVQDVSMAIWLRRDVARLGIAPLTSMFWYDEGNVRARADWRPEIHDSDGLLIHNRAGERIWRPLGNPPRPAVNSFADPIGGGRGPVAVGGGAGFGLFQRDRNFDHYQDDGVFYEKRPSLWVEPRGDWGPGAVTLYEIPTTKETDDNIVAFWTPDRPARAGSSFAFDYRLRWIGGEPAPSPVARVVDRWTGVAGHPGSDPLPGARRLVADFDGAALAGLGRDAGVKAAVTVDRGRLISATAYPVVGQPARWRLIVDTTVADAPANVRATLERNGTALSETLIHQFY